MPFLFERLHRIAMDIREPSLSTRVLQHQKCKKELHELQVSSQNTEINELGTASSTRSQVGDAPIRYITCYSYTYLDIGYHPCLVSSCCVLIEAILEKLTRSSEREWLDLRRTPGPMLAI